MHGLINLLIDMIIKLLTGKNSYSMTGYFDTFSDEKAEHPSAIVEDTVKLVQALHKHLLDFYSFFLSYDIMLHFLRIKQMIYFET